MKSRPTIISLIFGFAGAIASVLVAAFFWRHLTNIYYTGSIWPLPGFYVIEIIILSACGVVGVILGRTEWYGRRGASLTFLVAGAFWGLVILGAWSIGFFLLPTAVCFSVAGIALVKFSALRWWSCLLWFATGLFAQAFLMILNIKLLNVVFYGGSR